MAILCYHTVDPTWDQRLAVAPAEFVEQCEWIARHRDVIPLDLMLGHLTRRWQPQRRLSAITFDDGWAGVYHHAWPVLRRLNLPFTVFVVAETLVRPELTVDWVIDPPDGPLDVLTIDQVREMHDAGVSIESHSSRHADLTTLSDEECLRDLRESREILEDVIGAEIRSIAYPSGRHNQRVRDVAQAAGYREAYTLPTSPEPVCRYAIPRVGIYPGNTTRTLRMKCHPRYFDVRWSPAWKHLKGISSLRTLRTS